MAETNESISLDVETIYLGGKEYHVKTAHGSVSVIVYGDRDKPGLVTYSDLALNHMSCFQGLFFYPEAASLLLHNFCIYHISPPGHELGAGAICPNDSVPSAENLADQILEVLNFFRLDAVMCMGATAGAYILSLFATKYRERVLGLILVSPLCKAPSWTEWLYNKVVSNLLYFYGMCGLVKECLLKRYFSQELRGNAEIPESDIVQACRRLLDERQSINVLRFLEAMNGRPDISDGLKKLQCRTLIFVGDESPFYSEAIHMMSKLDKRCSALVENKMMEELHSQGKTTEDIAQCLSQTPLEPQIIAAIKAAHAAGCELRIISDANQFFIETILKHHGLLNCFTEIITNPSLIDEQGKLRISPYHDSGLSPHGCNLCPPNMCKGLILEKTRATIEKGGNNTTFIYLGDGGGDYCPSLKLGNGDHVMPRKNYPLFEKIRRNPKLIQAQVHEWNDAGELYNTLVYLIRYECDRSQLG